MATLPNRLRSVREQIVDQLRNEVLSAGLQAEQPLRESELAERFGVSRGPIRDALLQLTHEGALVYHPNRGVRVGQPVSNGLRELLISIRRQIETYALDSTFDDIQDGDHNLWGEMLSDLQRACEVGEMSQIVEQDMAFHRSLVLRTESPDLESIWLSVTVRMRLAYSRHTDLTEVYDEHSRIVDAIKRGDRAGALQRLENHIV